MQFPARSPSFAPRSVMTSKRSTVGGATKVTRRKPLPPVARPKLSPPPAPARKPEKHAAGGISSIAKSAVGALLCLAATVYVANLPPPCRQLATPLVLRLPDHPSGDTGLLLSNTQVEQLFWTGANYPSSRIVVFGGSESARVATTAALHGLRFLQHDLQHAVDGPARAIECALTHGAINVCPAHSAPAVLHALGELPEADLVLLSRNASVQGVRSNPATVLPVKFHMARPVNAPRGLIVVVLEPHLDQVTPNIVRFCHCAAPHASQCSPRARPRAQVSIRMMRSANMLARYMDNMDVTLALLPHPSLAGAAARLNSFQGANVLRVLGVPADRILWGQDPAPAIRQLVQAHPSAGARLRVLSADATLDSALAGPLHDVLAAKGVAYTRFSAKAELDEQREQHNMAQQLC